MKKNKIYKYIIFIFAFIGLFNSLITNSNPIIGKTKDGIYFPAFRDFFCDLGLLKPTLINREYEWKIPAPFKFKANDINLDHQFLSPAQGYNLNHFLGTDELGRDVLAGIIRGCYTSLRIGILSTIICCLIGLLIGIAMAYNKHRPIKMQWYEIGFLLINILLFLFYLLYKSWLSILFLISIIAGLVYIAKKKNKSGIAFPFDELMMGIIEIRRSIPGIILILLFIPLFSKPSINNIILIIIVLGWTNFARHARAQTLSLLNKDFIVAAKMFNADFLYIARKHIFPNILPTILVIATMSMASNILIESSLSFLGLGIPAGEVSWGSLLNDARKNFNAWWLLVFPGIFLVTTIYTFNKLKISNE